MTATNRTEAEIVKDLLYARQRAKERLAEARTAQVQLAEAVANLNAADGEVHTLTAELLEQAGAMVTDEERLERMKLGVR